ncbi:MAG: hypothetical protein KAI79_10130, partial [Bacteroidales bacterium]|nr:hypothetical protein [Bacteroidales bacterium]
VLQDFVIVAPVALETGEVLSETGLILDKEQNNSIINRPTTGVVVTIGPKTETVAVGDTLIWVEEDGMEMEFKDGVFLILRENSILGYKKG